VAKGLDEDPDNGCLHHYILFSSTVPLLQVGIYTLLPPPFEPTECPVSCGFRSTPILFASLMTRPTTPTGREGQFYYIFNYGTFAWVTALNIHSVRAHSPLIMTVCPPEPPPPPPPTLLLSAPSYSSTSTTTRRRNHHPPTPCVFSRTSESSL
jgi:hypothetical protein